MIYRYIIFILIITLLIISLVEMSKCEVIWETSRDGEKFYTIGNIMVFKWMDSKGNIHIHAKNTEKSSQPSLTGHRDYPPNPVLIEYEDLLNNKTKIINNVEAKRTRESIDMAFEEFKRLEYWETLSFADGPTLGEIYGYEVFRKAHSSDVPDCVGLMEDWILFASDNDVSNLRAEAEAYSSYVIENYPEEWERAVDFLESLLDKEWLVPSSKESTTKEIVSAIDRLSGSKTTSYINERGEEIKEILVRPGIGFSFE